MRTSSVNGYYRNPVASSASNLVSQLTDIKNSIPVSFNSDEFNPNPVPVVQVPELSEIYEQSGFGTTEGNNFIAHTNRLSGISTVNPDTVELPHYDQAIAIGRSLLYVVHQTDGIQNNAPILGTFTSIFIEPELKALSSNIAPYAGMIANSIVISSSTFGEDTVTSYSSNLSPQVIATITSDVKTVKSIFERRRRHDENFWSKSKQIVEEFDKLKRMNQPSETQQKVVDGYIGSDKYKENSLVKDVPVGPAYNVSVAYNGTITYNSNNPSVDSYIVPSAVVRNTPIVGSLDFVSQLPTIGNVVGDEYYVNTTGETYRWDGSRWVLIRSTASQTISLEDYINFYNTNPLIVNIPGGFQVTLNPGALIFSSDNGVWAERRTITLTNTGTNDYTYAGFAVSNFINSEVEVNFEPEDFPVTKNLAVGNTITLNVTARSVTQGNTVDYGIITILPGIPIQLKVLSFVTQFGVLLPNAVSQNVGSSTSRLPINVEQGPFALLASDAVGPEFWTWRNDSEDSLIISTVDNITDANSTDDMTITFYQANTPNTLNVNDSVLWYANVNAHVEFPNVATYKVTTTDGQERLLKIGIDPGNVDDSNLYNEVVNTNPDIVVTTAPFNIRIYGGKPNTAVTFTGHSSGTRQVDANGFAVIANNTITNIGTYTWTFDFVGTGHTRTLTKAIFT